MNEQLRNYIWLDFKRNNLPKYYHYFDMWVDNLTETQIYYCRNENDFKKEKEYSQTSIR